MTDQYPATPPQRPVQGPILSPEFVDFTVVQDQEVSTQHLRFVPFPNGLRTDRSAATFMDADNHIFIKPLGSHDYSAYTQLREAGLVIGAPVNGAESGQPELVAFGEADLIPLSSVFNASVTVPDAFEDLVESVVKIAKYIKTMKEVCGFVPMDVSLASWAIDRSTSKVELLPPILTNTIDTPDKKYKELVADTWARAQKQPQAQQLVINSVFAEARARIDGVQ
jgi:hypothetical protein